MAIVKMSKFSLLSFNSEKELLLDTLYKFGKVQFVNLQEKDVEELSFLNKDSEKLKVSEIQDKQSKLKFCLDFLNNYIDKDSAITVLKQGKKTVLYDELKKIGTESSWEGYYSALKEKEKRLNQIKNEYTKLNSEIEVLNPWTSLDIEFKELKEMKTSLCFIGSIPKMYTENFIEEFNSNIENSYLEVISEIKTDLNILVVFHKEEEEKVLGVLKSFGFNKANFNYQGAPYNIIRALEAEKGELLNEEEEIRNSIKEYKDKQGEIKEVYEYYSNLYDKASASENFLKSENILAIEGWIPTNYINQLEEKIKSVLGEEYYITFEDAQYNDAEVPVQLKNNKVVKAFESITKMYSIPRYNEVDPTPLLTPFYLVFFGMMLADVGYGLLMFIASILALKLFNLDEDKKDFVRFFLYLSIPTALIGWAYGGFFGDAIPIKGLINPSKNVVIIMIISVLLGIIQIYFALGIKAYMQIKAKQYKDAFYDAFSWYASLTGGILFLASGALKLSPTATSFCKYLMIVGMIAIVLTQGRENKTIGAKLGAGLYALYGISGYVGDLVSYSRLMALGLAGGFIGSAFNLMIGLIGNPILKIIFGTLIFAGGHVFNLLLSALGAYVHTCRLQYVEYFGKFYEGGGKEYKPFGTKNKFINIKNK